MSEHLSIPTPSPTVASPAAKPGLQVTESPEEGIYVKALQSLPIQRKLTIGTADDPLEDEADAMADRVIRMPGPSFIQRKCAHCEDEVRLQRKPLTSFIQRKGGEGNVVVTDAIATGIESTKGRGDPLPASAKSFMESRFGANFSNVRIHAGSDAMQLSKEMNAQAFTVANDIYFNSGKFSPGSPDGQHLLAHELTHTIQQNASPTLKLQRQTVMHGGATGTPSNWASQVTAANTAALKAALIQTVVGSSVTIVDKTSQSSGDPTPDPVHLSPYTASGATVNFDNNLQSKAARRGGRSLSSNAGYTFSHNNNSYVVLSAIAIDPGNYYNTVYTLNHELDHVRQDIAHSTLTGNASELDAWTSSFIREFHRSYVIQENTTTGSCQIRSSQQYVPLLGYYEASGVPAAEKTRAVQRISTYFNSVIQPHAGHLAIFRYWLRRSLNQTTHALADDLIAGLSLQIASADPMANYTRFSCSGIASLTFPSGPSASLPAFPSPGAATSGTVAPPPHP